jgi:hypothetical protein
MSTATTTSTDTGQHTSTHSRQREAQQPVTQQERSAANRLRATMAAVKLSFTWLGVRKTLAPEQRTRLPERSMPTGTCSRPANSSSTRRTPPTVPLPPFARKPRATGGP